MLMTILTVLVVIFGLVAAYYAWRTYGATRNKRQLFYSLSPLVSLLGGVPRSEAVRQNLDVLYDGKPIPHPGVIWLRLRTKGNKDITTNDFDQQRALTFDLQASIVDILSIEILPSSNVTPTISYEGAKVVISPDLIRVDSVLLIAILIDGKHARLGSIDARLIDVQVRQEDYSYPQEEVAAATRVALGFRPPRD